MDVNSPTADLKTSLPIKYILCAGIAGVVAKIYDDIEDNFRLEQLKTAHNMEVLKGIHYVTFTLVSMAYPLFFIIFYFAALINKLIVPSSYIIPYENSLFYSFGLLFLFLDYSKVTEITINECYLFVIAIACALGEEIHDYILTPFNNNNVNAILLNNLKEEVSFKKLFTRTACIISSIVLYFTCNFSDNLNFFIIYFIAYAFISCCTQFYSLYIYKPPQPFEVSPIIEEKKEEIFEQTEVKEYTGPPIITSEPTI